MEREALAVLAAVGAVEGIALVWHLALVCVFCTSQCLHCAVTAALSVSVCERAKSSWLAVANSFAARQLAQLLTQMALEEMEELCKRKELVPLEKPTPNDTFPGDTCAAPPAGSKQTVHIEEAAEPSGGSAQQESRHPSSCTLLASPLLMRALARCLTLGEPSPFRSRDHSPFAGAGQSAAERLMYARPSSQREFARASARARPPYRVNKQRSMPAKQVSTLTAPPLVASPSLPLRAASDATRLRRAVPADDGAKPQVDKGRRFAETLNREQRERMKTILGVHELSGEPATPVQSITFSVLQTLKYLDVPKDLQRGLMSYKVTSLNRELEQLHIETQQALHVLTAEPQTQAEKPRSMGLLRQMSNAGGSKPE